jgi:hypothetical protein
MRLVGVLVATALLLAGCGSDGLERASATSDARKLLSATVNNLPQLKSATVDAKFTATQGGENTSIVVRGPFEAGEKGKLPRLALNAEVKAPGVTETGGVTLTGDSVYVTLKGTSYEVPSLLTGQLEAGLQEQLGKGGTPFNIDVKRWVPNPTNAGLADVGGVETVKLTGAADIKRVATDLNLLAGQLQALPGAQQYAPEKVSPEELAEKVQDVTVTVYTGAEDQQLRRLVVEGTVAGESAETSGDVLADITLTNVGEDQKIEAPKNVKPFSELMNQFGAGNFAFG